MKDWKPKYKLGQAVVFVRNRFPVEGVINSVTMFATVTNPEPSTVYEICRAGKLRCDRATDISILRACRKPKDIAP